MLTQTDEICFCFLSHVMISFKEGLILLQYLRLSCASVLRLRGGSLIVRRGVRALLTKWFNLLGLLLLFQKILWRNSILTKCKRVSWWGFLLCVACCLLSRSTFSKIILSPSVALTAHRFLSSCLLLLTSIMTWPDPSSFESGRVVICRVFTFNVTATSNWFLPDLFGLGE